ncbi:ASCH domain-containing protein [Paenibacillus vulneris]|uniref:Transcriptional regulator n=1 Tax=Paenibacillus vulneris TaxID=1133364 RepID=A0ABW3UXB0_9BACL
MNAHDERNKRRIILSLQPKPYNEILKGIKKFEYRRAFLKEAVTAFIYVSSPVKELRGIIEFGTPIIDSAARIAAIAEREHPGWGQGITSYLKGLDKGYAIPIRSICEFQPIALQELRDKYGFTPPQSYMYLESNKKLADDLLNRAAGMLASDPNNC